MTSAQNDLTITTRSFFGGHETERTVYSQFDRSRDEFRPSEGGRRADGAVVQTYGPRMAIIRRCDLMMLFALNLDDREYDSSPLRGYPTKQEREVFRAAAPVAEPPEPTVVVQTTTVDTGERKEAFGFTARRVITTRKHIPLSHASEPLEMKTDGWYVDLDPTISCERWWPAGGHRGHTFLSTRWLNAPGEGPPPEIPRFTDIGAPETGYAIEAESVTISQATLPDGTTKEFRHSSKTWVTALSIEPLDPALFEVPPGFRKVQSVRQR